jgi:hypothetical protein
LEKCDASSQQWIDGDAPKYSLNGTNATSILTVNAILIYANWTDDYDLNYSWLWTNETGGAGINYTGGIHGSPYDINLSAGQTWSNYSWQNTSLTADTVVGWRIYANDSANNVNFTEGTFTVHIPDATFSVAMPTAYQFYNISGASESLATNTTPRNISFNFSTIPQYWVEPCAGSDCTSSQQNASLNRPIYLIQATGNVPIGIGIRLNASLATGLSMSANATCNGTYGSCQGTLQTIGMTYVNLVTQLNTDTISFANITLFANLTGSVAAGEKGYKILINASYSKISDGFVSFDAYNLDSNWKNYAYSPYNLYIDDKKKNRYNITSWYEWR